MFISLLFQFVYHYYLKWMKKRFFMHSRILALNIRIYAYLTVKYLFNMVVDVILNEKKLENAKKIKSINFLLMIQLFLHVHIGT